VRWLGSALVLLLAVMPAQAQMDDAANGTPRPVADLPAGTVTVRIVRGLVTEPIIGVPVTLTEQGKADSTRAGRTDAEGRATFKDLPAGSRWVGTATIDEKDLTTQLIEVPPKGGIRVLLSPVPLQMAPGAAGGGGAQGGGGDPPMSPLDMRAKARGERTLAPGSIQLRVVHGEWRKPVVGHTIHLIGLAGTGEVVHEQKATGKDGRVLFSNLRHDVAWYPMAVLPSPAGGDDRLVGQGVSLPPRVGIAMALSGRAPDAKLPLDDLDEFVFEQDAPAGEIHIRVRGAEAQLAEVEEIELLDAFTSTTLARSAVNPAKRMVAGQFIAHAARPDYPDARVVVGVLRGTQQRPVAVEGMHVELRPEQGPPLVKETDDNGAAAYDGLVPGTTYTPAVVQFGTSVVGEPFKVPEKNGLVAVAFMDWEDPVKVAGLRAVPGGNDHAYVIRTQAGGRVQLSQPFQLTSTAGAVVPLELAPPPEFEFHLAGTIDDEQMNFQAQLAMSNGPASPWTPPGGKLHIPLPRGAGGVQIEEAWSDRVKIERGGLAWKGAVPPGGFQFNMSFDLPIDDGSFTMDMDVPSGASQSSIVLEYRAGMQIATLGKSQGRTASQQGRRFYVISDINVAPQQALVMKVTGMPQQPHWRRWVRNGVGLGVIALLAAGVAAVLLRRGPRGGATATAGSERDRLLDQLVDLERRHRDGSLPEAKFAKQRARLVQRLEPMFGDKKPEPPPEA
jgi:hypothetical protein